MLSKVHVPLVYIAQSTDVNRLIQKNGNLRITDLFNTFSSHEKSNEFLKSLGKEETPEEGKRKDMMTMRVRFIEHFQFHKITESQADLYLQNNLIHKNENDIPKDEKKNKEEKKNGYYPDLILDYPPIENVKDVQTLISKLSPDPTPWYTSFTHTFMETFRCEMSTSQLYCPLLLVYIISSIEENPLQKLKKLITREKPMSEHYDWNTILPYFIIVHDEIEGAGKDPDELMTMIAQHYPKITCYILRINSLTIPNKERNDLWTSHPLSEPLLPDNLHTFPAAHATIGCLLSEQDLANVQTFVADLIHTVVAPALDNRLKTLNETILASKQNRKSRTKSWWRMPKTPSSSKTPKSINFNSSNKYRYDTLTAQTRLLGDTAFLLHDYKTALQMYKTVLVEYTADKCHLYVGSVNEMIALCIFFLLDNKDTYSPSQVTDCIEEALTAYTQEGTTAAYRLATRAVVLASDMLTALQQQSKKGNDYMTAASELLIRGSRLNAGIISALLLERAAFCDLLNPVPKFRKFAFRLIIAGQMYQALDMMQYAVRCYVLARSVYDKSGWIHIEDHVNFTLAQQLCKMERVSDSVPFFLKLVCSGMSTPLLLEP